MSGYNRIEQTIGGVLNRFPRTKSAVESVYQRTNYYLHADRDFRYNLHEDATLQTAETWASCPDQKFYHSKGYGGRYVGFFDVCPWDEGMGRYLLHEASNEGGRAEIICLSEGGAISIGTTRAWNYQQGSRTHWHPTRDKDILFNDLDDGAAVARLVTVTGDVIETYDRPVQAVDPTGDGFLSVNYRRLDRNSPGYGYGTDDGSTLRSPDEDGIFHLSFDGNEELLIPYTDLLGQSDSTVSHERHFIHHVRYAPDGERFAFLHRWRDGKREHTQLMVTESDGSVSLLLENRFLSHFCWLDPDRLFLWGGSESFGRGYYIVNVATDEISYVDELDGFGDGHPSLSPDGEWVVTDSYPDRRRRRSLTLFHLASGRTIDLGEFFAPFGFDGTRRCDLHPRWSPDGRFVSIDSAHDGTRRSYVIDVRDYISDG